MMHRLDITKTNTQHPDFCLPETQNFRLNGCLLGVAKKDIHNITPRGVFFEAIEGGVIVSRVSRFHTLFANLKKIKKIKKAEQSFDHPAFFKNLLFYLFIWNIFVHYGFLRGLL